MRVRWLKTALHNLDEQAEFIAQDNRQAAVRMVERVEHAVTRLGQHPAMGRTGRVPLTRELMVAGTPFIVVYRVRETVEVLRVLHAAQAWPPR